MIEYSILFLVVGTVDVVDKHESNEDVYPLTHADLKRFSYPRPSNHCPTCSCQHFIVTNALLLAKRNKKTSEEMFEEESAKKKSQLTESIFHIKASTSVQGMIKYAQFSCIFCSIFL